MVRIKTLFIFKTSFYNPQYKEFYSSDELKNFLHSFDFMQSHAISNVPTGLPEFQLGCCFGVHVNGDFCKSNIKWGPRFIVGSEVREDEKGRIFVKVPMDKKETSDVSSVVYREYQEIRFNKNMADAIIDLVSMQQIWPKRKHSKTELVKFLLYAIKESYKLKYR